MLINCKLFRVLGIVEELYRRLKKTRTELRDKKLVALHGHQRRLQRRAAQERQRNGGERHLRRRRVRQVRATDHQ